MIFQKKYKSINDLNSIETIKNWRNLRQRAKDQVKILVVDDQPFAPLEPLRNNGFQIRYVQDITDLTQLEGYPVVLFDLQGVGITLDPTMQGAHLIRQTKKTYPDKYIIAYTGSAQDDKMQQAITEADIYVAKDMPMGEWCDTLEAAVEEIANPVKAWKKFRYRLLDEGITPIQLSELENTFVENYRRGEEKLQKSLLESLGANNVDSQLKAVATGLLKVALKQIVYVATHA